MTTRLEEVVADVHELPDDEHEGAAEVLLMFLREWPDDTWRVA